MAVVGVGPSGGINNMASGFSKICRTCASCTDCLMPIFSGEGLLNNLPDKIHRHLPIKVSEWDRLPQQLCRQCASTLLAWHELVKCCTQADAALRTRLQRIQEHSAEEKATTTSGTSIPSEKVPTEPKWTGGKEIDFRRYLEGILLNYIDVTKRQADSPVDNIIYVCQKCEKYSPFHTVEALAEHLEQMHIHEIPDEAGITHFVTENLILVETLEESLPEGNLIVKPEAKIEVTQLAPVRPRKQHDTTEETLNKLCCPFCQKIFSAPKRLMVHLNVHPEVSLKDGYLCRCCLFSCTDVPSFVAHLQEEHVLMDIEGTQQVCRSCGFICDSKPELHEHVKTFHAVEDNVNKLAEEKPAKVSSRNPKYIPVECPVCRKIVSNKYNLNAHMKQHTQQMDSYSCTDCGKTYRSQGSLKWHRETVHLGILKYICLQCGEAFPSKMYRDNHGRIHSGETPFQCASCGKSFRSKNSLVVHMKSHLDIRKYACTRCPKKFQKSTHLKYHLKSHDKKDSKQNVKDAGAIPETCDSRLSHTSHLKQTETRDPICLDDEKTDDHETSLDSHLESLKTEPQSSPLHDYDNNTPCSSESDDDKPLLEIASKKIKFKQLNRFYKALLNLKRHYESNHGISDSSASLSDTEEETTNRNCDDLTLSNKRRDCFDAETREELNRARTVLDGKVYYRCAQCGKNLRTTHTYIHHARIHTGEKPCVCHLCGKQFRVNAGLHRHLRETHQKLKLHSCDICQKSFSNRQNLVQHTRIHTGEKPFVCNQCGKRFTQSGSLHIHMKTHTDYYPYECATCDAKFRQRSALTHHTYNHTGEKPNVCSYCGKAYKVKHQLNMHILIHTEQRPHACPVCGLAFRQRRTMRNHCKRTHDCVPQDIGNDKV